jgi:hypothetical protein
MTNRPKADPDKADERAARAPDVNDPTFRTTQNMPTKATEQPAKADKVASRIKGAYFLGGTWYAADGTLLTPPEMQQAHKAMDAAAAEARRKALLGGDR